MQRRGYHAIHGDRELVYQVGPETGAPTVGFKPEHHIWHVDKVKALVDNQDDAVTFFCGGSRNYLKFIALFDGVFVLRPTWKPLSGGLMSEWRWTQLTGEADQRNGKLVPECIKRKKGFPKTGLQSMPPHRSRTSLTKFSVKSKQMNTNDSKSPESTRHSPRCFPEIQQCQKVGRKTCHFPLNFLF
ncbi:hypothetical protein ABE504_08700 [Paenibacillus oryzisoli]|uniref:hypothetical protein n=1 Tax=Paenibacillus oryzisoli TaxID=1850517 RepID=UPI003D29B242